MTLYFTDLPHNVCLGHYTEPIDGVLYFKRRNYFQQPISFESKSKCSLPQVTGPVLMTFVISGHRVRTWWRSGAPIGACVPISLQAEAGRQIRGVYIGTIRSRDTRLVWFSPKPSERLVIRPICTLPCIHRRLSQKNLSIAWDTTHSKHPPIVAMQPATSWRHVDLPSVDASPDWSIKGQQNRETHANRQTMPANLKSAGSVSKFVRVKSWFMSRQAHMTSTNIETGAE